MQIAAWLSDWNYWHWMILGTALLLLELFGTAGVLLWTGIAAWLTAMCVFVLIPSVYTQWNLFAVFSIITTWCWFRFTKGKKKTTEGASLNQRTQRCIGAQTTLLEDVRLGKSRVRLDDTFWVVLSTEPLKAGDSVKIIAVDGTHLIVKSLQPPASQK